jgi:hypothetical protein
MVPSELTLRENGGTSKRVDSGHFWYQIIMFHNGKRFCGW